MKVEIRMEGGTSDSALRRAIRRAAETALRAAGAPENGSLSVLVTGDDAVRALNLQFTGTDAATDVLSFPTGDPDLWELDGYLGDVVISLETARRQAGAGGHAITHEIELLTVHGVLHLLGHDHGEAGEKAAMWQAQADALATLENPLSPP